MEVFDSIATRKQNRTEYQKGKIQDTMTARISQSQIQFIRSLHHTKYRQKLQKFIIEGDKICSERLQYRDVEIEGIYALKSWLDLHHDSLEGIQCTEVSPDQLLKISTLKTPNQVLGVCRKPMESRDFNHFKNNLCFYLDAIQDPGNMGTILRTLDWFGFRTLYLSPGCVDVYNPKVVQGSMGSLFNVHIIERPLQELTGNADEITIPVMGTGLEGENVFQFTFPGNGLLVIGNEGKGISPEIQPYIRQSLTIPATKKATAESLNAAVACGILAALAAAQR